MSIQEEPINKIMEEEVRGPAAEQLDDIMETKTLAELRGMTMENEVSDTMKELRRRGQRRRRMREALGPEGPLSGQQLRVTDRCNVELKAVMEISNLALASRGVCPASHRAHRGAETCGTLVRSEMGG